MANDVRTVLVRKRLQYLKRPATLILILAIALLIGLFSEASSIYQRGKLKNTSFLFEIVRTQQAREKGLSGRAALAPDAAMLFVFDEPANQCFWMKDMKFNIDILWFDSNKKLIYQKNGVSPDTYPQTFCADSPATYVVEVPSGTADKIGIRLGDTLQVDKL